MEAVGLICTPEDLRQAINDRREELGISLLALDHVSGCQSGYSAKLLARRAPIKGLGELSLPTLLGALGLHLVLVSDDAAIPRVTLNVMEERLAEQRRRARANSSEPVSEAA